MGFEICSQISKYQTHTEICYNGDSSCPLCEMIGDKDILQDELATTQEENKQLREELEELKNDIIRLKGG